MKKVFLILFSMFTVSAISFANDGGVIIKYGNGDDNSTLMDQSLTSNRSEDIYSFESFYEWNLQEKTSEGNYSLNKLGIKLGLDFYGKNKMELEYRDPEGIPMGYTTVVKEKTMAVPFTVYYKYDNGVKKFSYHVGGGFSFIKTVISITGMNDVKRQKWFPHIVVGGEYRLTQSFSLGVDFKYNFNAKLKRNNITLSNRSGLQGALFAKFYF